MLVGDRHRCQFLQDLRGCGSDQEHGTSLPEPQFPQLRDECNGSGAAIVLNSRLSGVDLKGYHTALFSLWGGAGALIESWPLWGVSVSGTDDDDRQARKSWQMVTFRAGMWDRGALEDPYPRYLVQGGGNVGTMSFLAGRGGWKPEACGQDKGTAGLGPCACVLSPVCHC